MRTNGTAPDEIRWPRVDEYRPATALTFESEDEAAVAV
jgi:hypothetical protein